MRPCIDKTGMKFGRVTVIERDGNRGGMIGKGPVMWKCRCDCGEICRISTGDLTNGRQKGCRSCGKQAQANKVAKTNKFVIKENIVYLDISTNKNHDTWTLLDRDDFGKIYAINRKVYAKAGRGGAIYAYVKPLNDKTRSLHRLIMSCKDHEQVDHINGNTLDNRKSNLRICTQSENNRNARLNRNNTTGCSGVGWHKRYQKYYVRIKENGKEKSLGYYSDLADAIKVRKIAEKKNGYHQNHGRPHSKNSQPQNSPYFKL
jgi:hypothetical protein